LLQIAQASRAPRLLPRPHKRRKQNACQYGNDRYHYEQLNQREPAPRSVHGSLLPPAGQLDVAPRNPLSAGKQPLLRAAKRSRKPNLACKSLLRRAWKADTNSAVPERPHECTPARQRWEADRNLPSWRDAINRALHL